MPVRCACFGVLNGTKLPSVSDWAANLGDTCAVTSSWTRQPDARQNHSCSMWIHMLRSENSRHYRNTPRTPSPHTGPTVLNIFWEDSEASAYLWDDRLHWQRFRKVMRLRFFRILKRKFLAFLALHRNNNWHHSAPTLHRDDAYMLKKTYRLTTWNLFVRP